MDGGAWSATVMGRKESEMTERLQSLTQQMNHTHFYMFSPYVF